MAAKKAKATKRAARRPAKAARAAATGDAVDVTDESADQVVGRIKLLCDNDTEVVFARVAGRLVMRLQERG
jgi:hypothetical protein